MDTDKAIRVDGLTDSQIALLQSLINEFHAANTDK